MKTKAMGDMQQFNHVEIKGRHFEVTDAIRSYTLEKMAKIERFSPRLIDLVVTLDVQKQNHIVNILLRFDQLRVKVVGVSDSMYASIDRAIEKLKHQVGKYKEKMKDHHRGEGELEMEVSFVRLQDEDVKEFNDEIEEENIRSEIESYRPHQIIKREKHPLKTLSFHEAIIKMEISGLPFMIFRLEEDQKIKIIYRCEDQNFGIIEPQI